MDLDQCNVEWPIIGIYLINIGQHFKCIRSKNWQVILNITIADLMFSYILTPVSFQSFQMLRKKTCKSWNYFHLQNLVDKICTYLWLINVFQCWFIANSIICAHSARSSQYVVPWSTENEPNLSNTQTTSRQEGEQHSIWCDNNTQCPVQLPRPPSVTYHCV
jgi:hypothetical protein